jgi:thiamine-phosphate pyrophosphorylase
MARGSSGDRLLARDTSLYLDFLVAPEAVDRAQHLLQAVLSTVPIASVLIRGTGGESQPIPTTLISVAQKSGVAALVAPPLDSLRDISSDGVHVQWSEDVVTRFKEARRLAPEGAIVGADAGRSRHDAMEIGEAGADYVAFGIPAHVTDRDKAAERRLDLIGWWSELFEIPCVAFDVADPAEATSLAAAGADFVAITLASHTDPEDAKQRLRSFADAVGLSERAQ